MELKKTLLGMAVVVAVGTTAGCGGGANETSSVSTVTAKAYTGTLKNENFHPLQAEIEAGTITPAATAACPTGTASAATNVTMFGKSFPVCLLNNHMTGNSTYSLTNDHIYVLTDYIKIGNGGIQDQAKATADATVLNMEAGTQIFAMAGQKAGIRVTRGATINVSGTAAMPAMMSAVDFNLSGGTITGDPTDLSGRGQWGGLVVNGYAPVDTNDAVGIPELISEAAPATETEVYFGGTDAADSSGAIEYLVIAESGVAFQPDAELQGLTLEGVGNGTTISHIQVLGSEDDGIEFFGGTVNVDHIVINGQDDDGLDFDDGYDGTISFAIIRMGDHDGDTGIEADSGKAGTAVAQNANPTLAHITVLGNKGKSSKASLGAMFKDTLGFPGHFYRTAFVDDPAVPAGAGSGFDGACFDVDTALNANLAATDVVCYTAAAEIAAADADAASAGGSLQADWKAGANYDVSTAAVTVDGTTLAVSGVTPGGAAPTLPTGLTAGNYVGAVDPAATGTMWWDGWTAHLAY